MLKLSNIVKTYEAGDTKVEALKGVSMEFRRNEFVSILGPSGCGKTTMLNIIGGLDRYTSGDLEINGKSTKKFKDKDWDTYRNHSIGFVFQSYNLIMHQSVLSNVELALTISGVSKAERRRRAIEVLQKVGLGDHIKKKPNQLSGGQMQRVAIARALINNPEILLADEPTGALDSETSVQVMELLKEIAQDKLVIMVTHNPELAEQYSTRIIKLLDGNVISDSTPYDGSEEPKKAETETETKKGKKVGMNFFTALSLSLNNLMTKKARTLMTAFAGSIGIIGIALIMSVSNGFQLYINKVQEDTLSTYPIEIDAEIVDMTNMLTSMMGAVENKEEHEDGYIYSTGSMLDMVNTLNQQVKINNLEAFKNYIESDSDVSEYANAVRYQYETDLHIYASDTSETITQLNPTDIINRVYGSDMSATMNAMSSMTNMSAMMQTWDELIDNKELLASQYDVVAGRWPSAYNEVVLVANEGGVINEMALYTLGIKDISELDNLMARAASGEVLSSSDVKMSYEEVLNMTFKLVINTDYYTDENNDGVWEDRSKDVLYLKELVDNGVEIKIVGIVMPAEEAVSTSINGAVGYTHELTEYVVNAVNDSEIVKQQTENPEIDVFTGLAFDYESTQTQQTTDMSGYPAVSGTDMSAAMMSGTDMSGYGDMSGMAGVDTSAMAGIDLSTLTEEEIALYTQYMAAAVSKNTYEDNMELFGVSDLESPSSIYIYPKDFDSKEALVDLISDYNASVEEADKITYTDYIGIMISGMSTIIDTISYVLIAFVSISLIVSSIMIGVITYISVLERTKEIGVLRAMGASKKDISRVFNAETLIVGFVAGAIGILATLLLCIPINIIINSLASIGQVAQLPLAGGVALILISMVLTVVAGLIPSRVAAKKDPVEALRTE